MRLSLCLIAAAIAYVSCANHRLENARIDYQRCLDEKALGPMDCEALKKQYEAERDRNVVQPTPIFTERVRDPWETRTPDDPESSPRGPSDDIFRQ